jgi:hypothetical protein
MLPYLIGFGLALSTFVFVRWARLDRDRALYPLIAIIVASYYVLFAAMGGSTDALVVESAVTMLFAIVAVVGFKSNLWLAAAAIAGHGIFDSIHGFLISNPGMPLWWPAFCGTYDVTLGLCLGYLLYSKKLLPILRA